MNCFNENQCNKENACIEPQFIKNESFVISIYIEKRIGHILVELSESYKNIPNLI
jgi:hypothetical protein